MSRTVHTAQPAALAETASNTEALRRLYYGRTAFAVLWAGLLVVSASTLTPVSVTLLLIYPLFDLCAAALDVRSSGATRLRGPLYLNMALSLLTAIALAVAVASGIPDVLRVWGVWAITAGVVQLVVAIRRYRLGGQRAMILSGGISAVAGTGFVLMATAPKASLVSLAGYATLGGVFFLISAIRLHHGEAGRRSTH
jgi:uncharacterized membrane protein HdeD (DUF308 family)